MSTIAMKLHTYGREYRGRKVASKKPPKRRSQEPDPSKGIDGYQASVLLSQCDNHLEFAAALKRIVDSVAEKGVW